MPTKKVKKKPVKRPTRPAKKKARTPYARLKTQAEKYPHTSLKALAETAGMWPIMKTPPEPKDPLPEGWTRFYREDRGWENTCPHGVGHPQPDDEDQVHGCDGCCNELRGGEPSFSDEDDGG